MPHTVVIRRSIVAFVLLLEVALAASRASAQSIITTAVGDPEVIAVAVDRASGAIYFATDRPGAIYQATGSGSVLVAGTSGGSTADGPAAQAAVFPGRNGLAVDASGRLFFSEPSLHRIRTISGSPAAIVTTIAGTGNSAPSDPRQLTGNTAIITSLAAPGALAFNPFTGDLFVADEAWDVVYRVVAGGTAITANSAVARAVGGNPSNTAIFLESTFYNPFGYAGDGGPASDAKLNHPRGLAVDAGGNLYIADTGNNVVRRVDSAGTITTLAGTSVPGFAGDTLSAEHAQLFMPTGVAVDVNGNLLIADTSNHRVRMVSAGTNTITTVAGGGATGHGGDGLTATSASLAYPTGVAADAAGRLLIADSQNNRVRQIALDHTISTVAQRGADYAGDGLPAGNALDRPLYLVFDHAGNMLFSDSGNARIRRKDGVTGQLTTVAGNGIPGYKGDNGPAIAARLNCPAGLSFATSGALFIADPCAQVVRRIDAGPDGLITGAADEVITTYAGNGVGHGTNDGDGEPASAVSLNGPFTVADDGGGGLLIGQPVVATIRRIDPSGTLSTYSTNTGSRGLVVEPRPNVYVADDFSSASIKCNFASQIGASRFGSGEIRWSALSLDGAGGLYVSEDAATQSVFEVKTVGGDSLCTTDGAIRVAAVAGSGRVGYSGDTGMASAATLNHPGGTVYDGATLYIADTGNNVIRALRPAAVDLSASPVLLDFGTVGLLTSSPNQIVTVTSVGTAAPTFGVATIAGGNAGDFAIVSDGCASAALANGQSCQIAVAFTAAAVGHRAATLQINDNAAGSPQLVSLTGIGATLGVVPASISFGAQPELVASAPVLVTVTNPSPTAVTNVALSLTGANAGDFSISADSCSGAVLAAHGSCTFKVTFTPQGAGAREAIVNVSSSAPDSRTVSISGSGVAAAPGTQLAPSAIAFATTTVGGSTPAIAITLTSSGTSPLLVNSVTLTGDQPRDFTVTGTTCSGVTLMPGQTCVVNVAFTPHEVCSSTAVLSIADNASDSPQSVALSGTGASGAAVPFQPMLFCTTHGAQPQEVAAGGDGATWFDESGSRFASPAIARATAASGVISEDITALLPAYKGFGLTFAPDGSRAFTEAENIGFQTYLTIVSAGGRIDSPFTFPGYLMAGPDGGFWLTHQFTCGDSDWSLVTDFAPDGKTVDYTFAGQWLPANANNHFCVHLSSIVTGPDGNVWVGITSGGSGITLPSPNGFIRLTRDGALIDFIVTDGAPNASAVGVDGYLYALVGTGASSCTLERFDSSGAGSPVPLDPAVFPGCTGIAGGADGRLWIQTTHFNGTAFESAFVALTPGSGSTQIYPMPSIAFNPAAIAAGPDEGIWFSTFDAVARLDIGGGASRAYVNPGLLSFGSTFAGLPTATQAVVVRSTGTAPLTINSVSIAGADSGQFVIGTDGCRGVTIAPGSACTVTVASKPTVAGTHAATLVINDNDAFSPQIVRLEEYTLPPQPSLSSASLNFATTKVGQQSAAATLTLTNPRDQALHVQSLAKSGPNGGEFIVADGCTNTDVPAHGTCSVTIVFAPAASGNRSATLTFTDAANPPTQMATLSGSGQASSGGTGSSCACATTGLFVNPVVVRPSATAVSPQGAFTLTVNPRSGTGAPDTLVIAKAAGGNVLTFTAPQDATWPTLDIDPPAWGFSPDDNRFVVHFQSAGEDTIKLFDLTSSTPGTPLWQTSLAIASGGSVIPSGSVGFSPNGKYLVATQLHTETAPPPTQTLYLWLVSTTTGTVAGGQAISWIVATPPARTDKVVESAHWGFSPDDKTFVFIRDQQPSGQVLRFVALPTGTQSPEVTFVSRVAAFVQFSPCGEAASLVANSATQETITVYSTDPAVAFAVLGSTNATSIGATTMTAGPTAYTANVSGATPDIYNLAVNAGAAGCSTSTSSGSGGGTKATTSSSPIFTAKTPPNVAFVGVPYTYTFEASGSPKPKFGLEADAPAWLTIDPDTGVVSGTPRASDVGSSSTTTIVYTVDAANGAPPSDTVGPFQVTISLAPPPSSGGSGPGGPYEADDDLMPFAGTGAPEPAPLPRTQSADVPPPTILLLPNGRGSISLPADVTPAVATFTYMETDLPTAPLGRLVFAGLDFTFAAVDGGTGAALSTIVDPPLATIVFRDQEMQSANTDISKLGLFWWSGTGWVNQLPCPGCGVNATTHSLTATLSHLGEYVLAAVPPPPPSLTITPATIHTTVGVAFAGTVATFPPAAALDRINQFSALVTWGDGQTSPASIESAAGAFIVSGSHTWSATGTYSIGITVFDNGTIQSAHGTATVAASPTPPQFTVASPPLANVQGVVYSYTFGATGVPSPTFALAAGAPSWLSIGSTTGLLTGTPPAGTATFTFTVVASNGVAPNAAAGPFVVAVTGQTGKSADLSLTIAGPSTATKGSTVTYTMVVTNKGPGAALNGDLLFLAGLDASFVSATPSPFMRANGVWTWRFARLEAGQSATFTIRLKLAKAGTVLALGDVASETLDPAFTDNVALAQTKVK